MKIYIEVVDKENNVLSKEEVRDKEDPTTAKTRLLASYGALRTNERTRKHICKHGPQGNLSCEVEDI